MSWNGAGGGGFGQQPAPAAGGFGAQPGAAPAAGGFGAAAPAAGFGAGAPAAAPGAGGFGAAPQAGAAGGFGAAPGAGGFGAPAAGAAGGFGQPAGAGVGAAPGVGGFGAAPQAPAAGGFGAPAAGGFGAGAAPAAAGFGAQPGAGMAPAPAAGGFGAAAPAAGFGAAPAAGAGGFGAAPQAGAAGGFGARPAGAAGAVGGFGQPATGGFGAAAGAASAPVNSDYDVPNPNGDILSSLAWSPTGTAKRLLACTSWDKTVRVWEVQTQPGQPMGNYGFNSVTAVQAAGVGQQTADQPPLTCAINNELNVAFGGCDKTVQLWDIASNQKRQVAAHDAPVSKIQFITVGGQSLLVSAGWDCKLRFWDLKNPAPVVEHVCQNPIFDFDAQGAPGYVAILEGRQVIIYNIAQRNITATLAPPDSCPFQFRRVTTFQNNQMNAPRVAAGTADGRLVVWNLHIQGNQPGQGVVGKQSKAHGSLHDPPAQYEYEAYPLNFMAMHPSGARMWSGASDGALKGFAADSDMNVNFVVKESVDAIPCAAQHPDGSLIAYGLGYDWSLGKDHYSKTAPNQIKIHMINAADLDKTVRQ